MKYVGLALYTCAVAALTAALTLVALYQLKPWEAQIAAAGIPHHVHSGDEVTLSWNTPVVQEWITADGEKMGEATTTLMEYNDESQEVRRNSLFRQDLSELILYLSTDPEMRGHLVRHGVNSQRLDAAARHFRDGAVNGEPYLTYTEKP